MTQPIPFDIDAEIARVTQLLATLTAAKGATSAPAPAEAETPAAPAVVEDAPAPAVAPVVTVSEDREHEVQGGELLGEIAARYGVPPAAIAFASAQAGRIISGDHLPTGARLIIPGVSAADAGMIIE